MILYILRRYIILSKYMSDVFYLPRYKHKGNKGEWGWEPYHYPQYNDALWSLCQTNFLTKQNLKTPLLTRYTVCSSTYLGGKTSQNDRYRLPSTDLVSPSHPIDIDSRDSWHHRSIHILSVTTAIYHPLGSCSSCIPPTMSRSCSISEHQNSRSSLRTVLGADIERSRHSLLESCYLRSTAWMGTSNNRSETQGVPNTR